MHTRYEVKGKRVKSTTTLIGEHLGWGNYQLIAWTRKHCLNGKDSREMFKEAGLIGTLAHSLIEKFVRDVYDSDKDEVVFNIEEHSTETYTQANNAFLGFCRWLDTKKGKVCFVETELQMVSDKYGYGGTCDAMCYIDGKLWLVDYKTSNNVYDSHYIQVAAYRQHWNESNPTVKIKKVMILKLSKEDIHFEEHILPCSKLDWGWKIFKLILKLEKLAKEK